jgi:hypothetical protein
MSNPIWTEFEKQNVSWAATILSLKKIHFDYDITAKCWDVQTATSWKTANNGFELAKIASTAQPVIQ